VNIPFTRPAVAPELEIVKKKEGKRPPVGT
jgi:hypothetical protein